jgi:hypothetical protein
MGNTVHAARRTRRPLARAAPATSPSPSRTACASALRSTTSAPPVSPSTSASSSPRHGRCVRPGRLVIGATNPGPAFAEAEMSKPLPPRRSTRPCRLQAGPPRPARRTRRHPRGRRRRTQPARRRARKGRPPRCPTCSTWVASPSCRTSTATPRCRSRRAWSTGSPWGMQVLARHHAGRPPVRRGPRRRARAPVAAVGLGRRGLTRSVSPRFGGVRGMAQSALSAVHHRGARW